MATLKTIRKRIASTRSTEKLTHAMKMIATSQLRRSQQRAFDARIYNSEISRMLVEAIKRGAAIDHPLFKERGTKTGVKDIYVITSDKGLCGTFNENLLKHVVRSTDKSYRIYVHGRKGRDFFRRNGIKVEEGGDVSIFIKRYLDGITDGMYLAYNRSKNAGVSELSLQRIIPAIPQDVKPKYTVDYIYEPGSSEVVEYLAQELIRSSFKLAHLESHAAELLARMVAMEKASKNARTLIEALTQQYNKARQSAITTELIDIVGGAEALK